MFNETQLPQLKKIGFKRINLKQVKVRRFNSGPAAKLTSQTLPSSSGRYVH